MRRVLLSLSLCAVIAVMGCEGDPLVPTSGSITLRLASAEAPASAASGAASAAAPGGEAPVVHRNGASTAADGAGAEPTGPSAVSPLALEPLESVRVRVSGPTPRTVTFPCGPATCEGTVDGLEPGTYSVVVEGLVGGAVDHFGQTSGVTVAADQNTEATIAFASFRPVLDPFEAEAVGVLRFPVSYSAVAGAEGYVVEWATSPGFTGAFNQSVTGTSTEVVVDEEAEYFVRVRAVNAVVGSDGRPSEAASLVAVQSVASVLVTPASPTIAAGETQQFAAEARDADDNVLTDITFLWITSNDNVATVDVNGLVTGVGEGDAIIYAVGEGLPGTATLTVTVTATQLAFTVDPIKVVEEAAMQAVQVEIQDANGNRVASASESVSLTIGTNPGGGVLSGTTIVNAIDGRATFSGLSIDWAGGGYTLVASSGTLTDATSAGFDVTPGAAPTGAALLANALYVDFNGLSTGSEASNVMFALESYGVTVDPFVDISALSIVEVTRDARFLVIPELERGDPVPDLSPEARQRIVDFVEKRGGTLIAFFSPLNAVNGLFGHSIALTGFTAPFAINGGNAAGTPFEFGPASLPSNNATTALDPATLPAGSLGIYTDATPVPGVVLIPQGAGRIIYMGWDWFNGAPFGTQDGGWVEVLRRATLF